MASVPILTSRIGGNVGVLGADYPGLFDVGDTEHLARSVARAERRPDYLAELKARGRNLVHLFDPPGEERAWADLISELFLIE